MTDGDDPIDFIRVLLVRGRVEPGLIRHIMTEARRVFGGSQVYIRAVDRVDRDQTIRDALQAGADPKEAAQRAGCSVATVRRRRSRWL